MEIEHEAKILDVDVKAVAERIHTLGGEDRGEVLQRRYVYDVVPPAPNKWVRLRESGDVTTLTVKMIEHDGIDGTREVETTVGDFDAMARVLEAMGFAPRSYQENRRWSFTLEGARLEIDSWPQIPPYLEIEADSLHEVMETAERLGFAPEALTSENTVKVYARYGIDLASIASLRFG
jgi:adenylate cyclase, class 2